MTVNTYLEAVSLVSPVDPYPFAHRALSEERCEQNTTSVKLPIRELK